MNDEIQDCSISLPYEKLAYAGLTPAMVDALPQDVKETIASGRLSPLIRINMKFKNGVTVEMPVKLRLATDRDGREMLIAYPVNRELKNDLNFVKKAFKNLDKGMVLIDNDRYVQKDPETNSLIICDKKDLRLEEKLREFEKVNDIELGQNQKQQFLQGRPVELNVGGEKVVVGLDLRCPDSFRELQGDMKEWERQKAIDYDIAHPEYIGLVQTDENRWEYKQVIEKGMNAQELRQRPAQAKSASMHR